MGEAFGCSLSISHPFIVWPVGVMGLERLRRSNIVYICRGLEKRMPSLPFDFNPTRSFACFFLPRTEFEPNS